MARVVIDQVIGIAMLKTLQVGFDYEAIVFHHCASKSVPLRT